MDAFTVIVENDESMWDDRTGSVYHFPRRYAKYLAPGTKVLYYKGRIKDVTYRRRRLADVPHYFGHAVVGRHYEDRNSEKGDLFAVIVDYVPFARAVPAKTKSGYHEVIPPSRASNYWRDGVRPASEDIYRSVVGLGDVGSVESTQVKSDRQDADQGFESGQEGNQTERFVTVYERDPRLRAQAIAIHGTACAVCAIDFGEAYGDWGRGFIHVHHVVPVSELDGPTRINPETDLIPLCPNCHAMVHRRRNRTLSIEELCVIYEGSH
jgi:predicted HNH restriction endonuclease